MKVLKLVLAIVCPILGTRALSAQPDSSEVVSHIETAALRFARELVPEGTLHFDPRPGGVRNHTAPSADRTSRSTPRLNALLSIPNSATALREAVICPGVVETKDCRLVGTKAFVELTEPRIVGNLAYVTLTLRTPSPSVHQPIFRRTISLTLEQSGATWRVVHSQVTSLS